MRLLLASMLLLAIAQPAIPRAAIARDALEFDSIASGKYRSSVDLSAYAPGPGARPPSHRFEGRLTLVGKPSTRTVVADRDFVSDADIAQARTLPGDFDYAFVQDGDALIPVRRGPIPSTHGW